MRTDRFTARPTHRPTVQLLDGTEIELPRRRERRPARVALAAVALVASVGGIVAVAQQVAGDKGKAQVVERRGPEVEVAANGRGHVVVLFPQATDATAVGAGDVEVVLVESQVAAPAAQPGQPAASAGTPTPTGREIVFTSRDASDGLVRHALEPAGNGRRMTVLARIGGKYVEARQSGGGEGVTVFTVAHPAKAPDPVAAAPAPAATPAPTEGQPAADGAAPAATPPTPPAPATPPVPAQAAVILIYAGGAPS